MPAAAIVFETSDGQLFAVLPDAVVREDHGLEAQATEHEVEQGAAISDHYRGRPDVWGAEIVISDAPIREIEGADGEFWFGVTGAEQSVSLEARAAPVVTELAKAGPPAKGVQFEQGTADLGSASIFTPDAGEITRRADNWQILVNARDEGWLATITTDLRTYRNMVLLFAEVSFTATDAKWARIEVRFREYRKAATATVEAAEPAFPRNEAQSNGGAQATSEADEAEDSQSLLSQGVDAIAGFF